MTNKQAERELDKLRKQECTCGCDETAIACHKAGCRYRLLAFMDLTLREFAGPLYAVAA